jgi:cell division transport system permease protein
MAFILFLLLIFGMAILKLDTIFKQAKEKIEVDIFFRDAAKMSQMKRLEKELSIDYRVNSVEFITKEDAWEKIKKGFGGDDALDAADGNPIETSLSVTLKKEHVQLDSVQKIEKELMTKYENIISDFSYSNVQFKTINKTWKNGLWYALILCSILIIIAVILINNTIRLAIFSKRFLIRTMQMVGAKHSFITKPFLVNSIYQGILSAVLAILLFIGASILMSDYKELFGELIFNKKNMEMNLFVFGIIILLGILISFLSTYFSIKKYLRLSQDKLYQQ